ncbi:hypothetical protein FS935_17860 [Metabacillus litoralis]|uniref:Uncharacterized protein n=1 Tax=Metabacillus litoralis TaxID=152268 RepID=A0A5C6VWI5_9BACI|nr:hypothetical protein [Metabacillus litoralis]TXC89340.1 hypothetical protein FS935_17860 [Metabacillus litoralis]
MIQMDPKWLLKKSFSSFVLLKIDFISDFLNLSTILRKYHRFFGFINDSGNLSAIRLFSTKIAQHHPAQAQ